jgi:hypothetical protein
MATQTNAVMLAGDAMQCKWFVFFSLDWNRYLIKSRRLVVLLRCQQTAAQRFSHKYKRQHSGVLASSGLRLMLVYSFGVVFGLP